MSAALAAENIWFNKAQCDDAERAYYEKLAGAKVMSPPMCLLSCIVLVVVVMVFTNPNISVLGLLFCFHF